MNEEEKVSDLNEKRNATIQTRDHRFLINKAGVLLYEATDEVEQKDLTPGDTIALQFREVLALADFVNAHREELVQADRKLAQTWRDVADELIDLLEAQAPGSAEEATVEVIQQLLHELGPVGFHGRQEPAKSPAGKWYQSLWTSDSSAPIFEQQWVPFLYAFHERLMERFPDRCPSEEEEA